MQLVKQEVKGMRDVLPREKALRDNVFENISNVYKKYGFNLIETPIVEHYENLTGNKGGENEKLTFFILKRGEKLQEAIENNEALCDCGLRYDLTLPLCRYYANNMENLPSPFKVFQFGDVFRADRPQKGRARQFKQCDIDIFGDKTISAEIELLTATTSFLDRFENLSFSIKINDRRLLKSICDKIGFDNSIYGSVLIALDKFDKIGIDGVKEELEKLEIPAELCNQYVELINNLNASNDKLAFLENFLSTDTDSEIISNLRFLIKAVQSNTNIKIDFDFSIVRGMGYYTGTIYEIYCENYGFAIGGGGRYDNMIKDFTGLDVAGVGISIGFERLILILQESNYNVIEKERKIAVLYSNNLSQNDFLALLKRVGELRKSNVVYLSKSNKNIGKQKNMLELDGYTTIIDIKSTDDFQKLDF